jgi:hypothetical protein
VKLNDLATENLLHHQVPNPLLQLQPDMLRQAHKDVHHREETVLKLPVEPFPKQLAMQSSAATHSARYGAEPITKQECREGRPDGVEPFHTSGDDGS